MWNGRTGKDNRTVYGHLVESHVHKHMKYIVYVSKNNKMIVEINFKVSLFYEQRHPDISDIVLLTPTLVDLIQNDMQCHGHECDRNSIRGPGHYMRS